MWGRELQGYRLGLRKRVVDFVGVRRQKQSVEDRLPLERLEKRIVHLEALVEGLQDSVHRDSVRHEKRMSELEKKMEPEALARALSDDARRRGL